MSWLSRLRSSLGRARESFSAVTRLGQPERPLTAEFWDELEETLILADFGVPATQKIITGLQTVAKQEEWTTADRPVARFRKDVERFLTLPNETLQLTQHPAVILIVGVNGSGKTTTIGKLAAQLQKQRKRVVLVAADTFRAAATEQLAV
ncbi:MAG: signal recognition particle receptor subunit alpha, partial [Candidatus Cybelea sp.]